jgi:hypothetical protein
VRWIDGYDGIVLAHTLPLGWMMVSESILRIDALGFCSGGFVLRPDSQLEQFSGQRIGGAWIQVVAPPAERRFNLNDVGPHPI